MTRKWWKDPVRRAEVSKKISDSLTGRVVKIPKDKVTPKVYFLRQFKKYKDYRVLVNGLPCERCGIVTGKNNLRPTFQKRMRRLQIKTIPAALKSKKLWADTCGCFCDECYN